jgi:hypothetical protein
MIRRNSILRTASLAFAVAVSLLATAAYAQATEAATIRLLVGRWEEKRAHECEVHHQFITLRSNGTFEVADAMDLCGLKVNLVWGGTWTVKGKRLQYIGTHSTHPDLMPIGVTFTDEILGISEAEWSMIEGDSGERSRAMRVGRE